MTLVLLWIALVRSAAADRAPPAPHRPEPPRLGGADTLAPGEVVVGVGGGLALMIPAAGLDVGVGVASRVDLGMRYATHLGIVHSFEYATRVRLWRASPGGVAVGLRMSLDYSFWVLRRALDFATEDFPLGNGLATSLGVLFAVPVRARVRLGLSLGFRVGLVDLVRVSQEAHEARANLRLRAISIDVGAEWRLANRRAFFLSVSLYVPTAGVVPLGYVPLLRFGWSFGL